MSIRKQYARYPRYITVTTAKSSAKNHATQVISREPGVRRFSELIPIYHFLAGWLDPNKNFKQITVNVVLSTLPGGLKLVDPV
ncbi:hypothetical protein [Levilactobacillus fujinensis]|uniref:Transposase n=2 Tax=Levilactobacillus fujinensis TaxID=2486024 RepID=A0ABW1TBT2_9LACO|nr:hypothetical protein [Levilactobacillus fujinensis]